MTIRIKYVSRFLEKLAGSAALLAVLTVSTFASGDSGYGKPLRDYVDDYPHLVRSAAQASLYAYPSDRNDRLKGLLEEDDWEIQRETGAWVHVQNGSLNMIAYKGTTCWRDLMSQISCSDFTHYSMSTRAGELRVPLKKVYRSLFDESGGMEAVDLIRSADSEDTFVFTGHSMGGALANISGILSVGLSRQRNWSVISYGMPGIFSEEGAAAMNSHCHHSCLRIADAGDPVTKGWHHGGMHYEIPSALPFGELGRMDEPAEHFMRNYLSSVRRLKLSDCVR